ncbi:MAG: hypothetical protein ACFCVK_05895 [Acidimicrobiales bacterium]
MLYLFAAEGPNGRHIPGDVNEVYWGSLAFVVIVAVLVRFAGAPATKAFRARTERIEAQLADARAERNAGEAALTATSAELPDVSEEEARIRDEAVEAAARVKADMINRAQAEADAVRTRGAGEVENYRRQAIADLTAEVARMTRDSAEAVVVNSLDDQVHADLLESYISRVEQTS